VFIFLLKIVERIDRMAVAKLQSMVKKKKITINEYSKIIWKNGFGYVVPGNDSRCET